MRLPRPRRRPLLVPLTVLLFLCGCGSKEVPGLDCPIGTAAVTYSGQIKPLLDLKCVACHSSQASNRYGAPLGIDYDTYAAARRSGDVGLLVIGGGTMPPQNQGFPGMPQEQRCLVNTWVRTNYAK